MSKRILMAAVCAAALGAVSGAGAADLGPMVLADGELDAVAAGSATSNSLGYGLANGSIFAGAGVRGLSSSSDNGKGSTSSSTTIAEGLGVGTGGQGVTGGTTTGTGNAGRFSTVVPVHAVTMYGGAGVTAAHTTTFGF